MLKELSVDHCFGIVPLLSTVMSGAGGTSSSQLRIEIYGPSGLRELLRGILRLTETVRCDFHNRVTSTKLLQASKWEIHCPRDLNC